MLKVFRLFAKTVFDQIWNGNMGLILKTVWQILNLKY
jgi:hypothetical protein